MKRKVRQPGWNWGCLSLGLAVALLSSAGLHGAGALPTKELDQAADDFADECFRDWNKGDPGELKILAREVAMVVGCDATAAKLLVEDTKPVGDKMNTHWHAVYRAYYFTHRELVADDSLWDDYPEMRAGEHCRKGMREITSMWESLLQARLTPGQFALWQGEMKLRHERRVKSGDAWLKLWTEKQEGAVRADFEDRATRLAQAVEMPEARAALLKPGVDAAVAAHTLISFAYGQKCLRVWDEDILYYQMSIIKSMERGPDTGYIFPVEAAAKAAAGAFDEAVDKLLTPVEKARLTAYHKKIEARIARIARDSSASMLRRNQARREPERQARMGRLLGSVVMDAKRRTEFEARLESAEKAIGEDWTARFIISATKQARTRAEDGDEEAILKQMERGGASFSDEEADAKALAARNEAWQAAIKALLDPAELGRWEAAEQRRCEQRASVFALVAVAELDRRLLLLPEQRAAIEKMALAAAQPLAALVIDPRELWQGEVDGSVVLVHAMGLKNVEAVLQGSQKEEFQRLAERCKSQWAKLQSQLSGKT